MFPAMALALMLSLNSAPIDSLSEFVSEHSITMSASEVLVSPFLSDDGGDGTRWLVTLHSDDRSMTAVYQSMNQAKLELWPVLVGLLAQCETLRKDPEFERWSASVGMDPDSRHTLRVFSLVNKQCGDLEELLGTQQTARILNIVGTQ